MVSTMDIIRIVNEAKRLGILILHNLDKIRNEYPRSQSQTLQMDQVRRPNPHLGEALLSQRTEYIMR
jgi:hypothetical protein